MKLSIKNDETDVFAIGRLGEIGKNTYGVQFQSEVILIDAGIKFPGDDLLGVDYVIPDCSHIIQNLHKIKALMITHGHRDHIGRIPYLLKQVSIPIYAGPLALALIANRLDEHGLLRKAELHEINEDTIIRLGKTSASFFRTTHSIPDALGIMAKTPSGNIVATGDFKFDFTPVGEPANPHKMVRTGEEGVLYPLSNSTNAGISALTKSEKTIGHSILKTSSKIEGRVIFASFVSSIFHLQQAADAVVATGRKVAVFGRSMENAIVSGQRLGCIKVPGDTFVGTHGISRLPANETIILCTGSQGEAMAALGRITNGTHRQIQIQPDDTAIFLSSLIPSNATSVNHLINLLSEAGAEIIHGKINNIHTSGHSGQEEQKLMPRLMKPKYFIPIHGRFRMLRVHASLAQNVDVPAENCFIVENGGVLALTSDSTRPAGHFVAGDVYTDGSGIDDTGNIVLRNRHLLSEEGPVLAVAIVNIKKREILAGPSILPRGFVYIRESGEMVNEAQRILFHVLRECLNGPDCSEYKLRKTMTSALQPFLLERAERHPMILPMVMTPDEK